MKKAAIALSGGVDSATAAWLLREQGFEVLGLHADLGLTAPAQAARLRELAAFLRIRLEIIPLQQAFRKQVMGYLIAEYRRARTPNPCVVCNQTIKFDRLFRRARELGAELFATGHYARTLLCPWGGGPTIGQGADAAKDQSYFLHRLPREVLPYLLFPLGHRTKTEVKNLAREIGLPIFQGQESQDACFLPPGGYREFLLREAGKTLTRPGDLVDLQGRKLGEHRGLYAYTIGQRRGMGLPGKEPYYVIRLDRQKNELVIGAKEDLERMECRVAGVHWLCPPPDLNGLRVRAQIRYRHRPAAASLSGDPELGLRIRFDDPQKAVTPGQAAVFYFGDALLGGGWIQEDATG
jgi:tRNA-uridine 2-sulfurtransferase